MTPTYDITPFEFEAWPKIARLNRHCVITEKIDGSNAAIHISDDAQRIAAQSRKRLIAPGKSTDNYGFAGWVAEHAETLLTDLGPGTHYGEWWGRGINRNYGLDVKLFSLFNTHRWTEPIVNDFQTDGLSVVPVLYQGPFRTDEVQATLTMMRKDGSYAAPGFDNPEGVVVFHTAANLSFKVTLEGDQAPKGASA